MIVFILVLGLLMAVHEYGHYLAARLCGVRVERFSIWGIGPRLFGRKFGDTDLCVSLFPVGAYVQLAGESPESSTGKADEFSSKAAWQKLCVVTAGPLMNALLALCLFILTFHFGQPTLTATVGKVLEGLPAQAAGILENDTILAIDGVKVSSWEDVLAGIRKNKGALEVQLERGGRTLTVSVSPKMQEMRDVFGRRRATAFIGVSPSGKMIYVRSGLLRSVGLGAKKFWEMTTMLVTSIGMMVTGAMPFKDSLTGPIGIFYMTRHAAEMGIVYLMYFVGSLSVSLFVLNLLPIPVLDGGHVLFILIEKAKGSPLHTKARERLSLAGMILLLGLMAFVIFQDISRFPIFGNLIKYFHR